MRSVASSAATDFIIVVWSFETMPSIVPKSPRASTGAVTRHSPPDFATATVDVPCAISTRSTFSRSKFITFLSRRSNVGLLNVDS